MPWLHLLVHVTPQQGRFTHHAATQSLKAGPTHDRGLQASRLVPLCISVQEWGLMGEGHNTCILSLTVCGVTKLPTLHAWTLLFNRLASMNMSCRS